VFEQVEAGPAIHLALEGLQPVDLSLDLPITPGQRHGRTHGVVVGVWGDAVMGWHRD